MLKQLICTGVALIAAPTAGAHEFTVTLVVPANAAPQARNAFLLASSERDIHVAETSEGHLGGLDSQLEIIPPGNALPPSDIVVAIAPAALPPTAAPIWSFEIGTLSARATATFLDTGADAFSARFKARYASLPDDIATRTYVAARLIDLAVRAQGGVDDTPALAAAVEGY